MKWMRRPMEYGAKKGATGAPMMALALLCYRLDLPPHKLLLKYAADAAKS